MNISGKTKIYGLIGNPIENSISPQIHNKLAEIFFLDIAYVPFKINENDQAKIFSALRQLNIAGVNVTSPYKNLDLKYFVAADENVSITRSVNTIKNVDGNFFAFNTDVYGIEKTFERNQVEIYNKNVLIFGSGGAAKSVLYAAAKKNPKTIYIANRTFEKAVQLKKMFGARFANTKIKVIGLDEIYSLKNIYLAVQATTVGFQNDLSIVKEDSFFKNVEVAFDLIYSPWETKFLTDARKFDAKIINGYEMVICQAMKSFEIWHDVRISKEIEDELFFYIKRFV